MTDRQFNVEAIARGLRMLRRLSVEATGPEITVKVDGVGTVTPPPEPDSPPKEKE